MPFDGKIGFDDDATPSQRRARLIAELRGEMPDWHWDFSIARNGCGTAGCAMGYAMRLWAIPSIKQLHRYLGLTDLQGIACFTHFGYGYYKLTEITPAMVADKLEALGTK